MSVPAYLDIQSCELVASYSQTTSKENTLFWLIAARSAISSINTLQLGQMEPGEWTKVLRQARRAHPGVQSTSMTHSFGRLFQ